MTPLGLEKVLHGHLPAADERTGLVLLRLDPRQARSATRARATCRRGAVLGMPTVVLRADGSRSAALPPVAGALLPAPSRPSC